MQNIDNRHRSFRPLGNGKYEEIENNVLTSRVFRDIKKDEDCESLSDLVTVWNDLECKFYKLALEKMTNE